MKRRCLIIFIMFFLLISCVSTNNKEVPEGFGNGLESGFVMESVEMNDGNRVDIHFYKTMQEVNDFFKAIIGEKWHVKRTLSMWEQIKLQGNKCNINHDDYQIITTDLYEIGEVGNVMFDKGLPYAVATIRQDNELRQYFYTILTKWDYNKVRYGRIDYIDDVEYNKRLAEYNKQLNEKKQKTEDNWSEFYGSLFSTISESQKAEQYQSQNQTNVYSLYQSGQGVSQISNQKMIQEQNRNNSSSYHYQNRAALNQYYANFMSAGSGNNAAVALGAAGRIQEYPISEQELRYYEDLLNSGVSSRDAAYQTYVRFRR